MRNKSSFLANSARKFLNSLCITALLLLAIPIVSKAEKPNSKFKGVQIGCITYSFRDLPSSLEEVLKYSVESGMSSVELMGGPVEAYAGAPAGNEIKQWRQTVSMNKFKEVRKMFEKAGVKIHILKLGEPSWSDEEIDYAFNVAKALGAKGITFEISESAAKRMAPFAAKHKMYAIMHNHGQPGDPNFSFDKILSYGDYLRLNFDIGHYYGVTGKNPADLIERLQSKITSVHIKDKTGPKDPTPNTNKEFGNAQTPIADVLNIIKKNKYNIYCDIELEYNVPQGSNSVKEVKRCMEYCRNILLK